MQMIWLGNTVEVWLRAAVLALATAALLLAVRRTIVRRGGHWATRTNTHFDDLVVELARSTRSWFITVLALALGGQLLALSEAASGGLRVAAVSTFVVQIGLWGNLVLRELVRRHTLGDGDADNAALMTMGALTFVARLILWSVLVLLGLDNLGVNITALVAGLGVGGVAVALAVQNILGDLFASLSIVLDKPFVVGDFIIVDDLLGTVEHVGLKTTRVRSLHGEQIVFANADLLNSRIRNYKQMQERRVVFTLGVTYDTSRDKLALIPQLMRSIVEGQSGARFDRAHFKGFGAFSLDFEVVYYVLDADYGRFMDLQQAINLDIVDGFAAAGIEFAFPTQTLHLHAVRPGTVEAARQVSL
jgi:small-conductance mechanosensitive channel